MARQSLHCWTLLGLGFRSRPVRPKSSRLHHRCGTSSFHSLGGGLAVVAACFWLRLRAIVRWGAECLAANMLSVQ
jgi:hypothetical protein